MTFIPNPLQSVNIPIRVVNGEVRFYYGDHVMHLVEGAVGALVLSRHCVATKGMLRILERTEELVIQEKGSQLMAEVRSKKPTRDGRTLLLEELVTSRVSIHLLEALRLRLRGTKHPELLDCACEIPALAGLTAKSINHAYTLISERFESHRRSHTGSVYRLVYFQRGNRWLRLARLRGEAEARFDAELVQMAANLGHISE